MTLLVYFYIAQILTPEVVRLYVYHILEINENATLVFLIAFQHGLVHQNFVFIRLLYFTYSIKRSFVVLIDCQYMHCLKVLVQKTSYLTPCNVPHE